MKTLTDSMILDKIDVENIIFLIGTGVFFFFAYIFIIVFLANPNKSKKLIIQCTIGMLIFVGLGCGSLYLVNYANDIKEDYKVEIATVVKKNKYKGGTQKHDSRSKEYAIYVEFEDGDKGYYKLHEPTRFEDIEIGDKVYVVIKTTRSNLVDCAYPIDEYTYTGEH